MASLNDSLKSYLATSRDPGTGTKPLSYSQSFSKLLPSFSSSTGADDATPEASGNWFHDAQNDPCFPTLVCNS